jgi:hypothetical protein
MLRQTHGLAIFLVAHCSPILGVSALVFAKLHLFALPTPWTEPSMASYQPKLPASSHRTSQIRFYQRLVM